MVDMYKFHNKNYGRSNSSVGAVGTARTKRNYSLLAFRQKTWEYNFTTGSVLDESPAVHNTRLHVHMV